jgi:hypothetical protein
MIFREHGFDVDAFIFRVGYGTGHQIGKNIGQCVFVRRDGKFLGDIVQ